MNFANLFSGKLVRRGPAWTALMAGAVLGWLPLAAATPNSVYTDLQENSPFGQPPPEPQVNTAPTRQPIQPQPQYDFVGYTVEGPNLVFVSFAQSRRGGRGGPATFEVAVGSSANGVTVDSFDPSTESVTVRFTDGGGRGNRGGGGNTQQLSLRQRDMQARGAMPQAQQQPLVVYSPFDTGGPQQGGPGNRRGGGQNQNQNQGGGGQNQGGGRGQGGGGNVVAANQNQGGRGNNANAQGNNNGNNNNNNVNVNNFQGGQQNQNRGGGRGGRGNQQAQNNQFGGGNNNGGFGNNNGGFGATNTGGFGNNNNGGGGFGSSGGISAPTLGTSSGFGNNSGSGSGFGNNATSSAFGGSSANSNTQQRRRIVSPTGQ